MEKPIHILAVDDEDSFTFFVKLNLQTYKERQFKVTTANSGTEGLKLAKVARPDLILLDVMMPDMSGAEVAEELKLDARTKSIPIIFVRALSKNYHVHKAAVKLGGGEFIAKPVSKDELISRIEATLNLN